MQKYLLLLLMCLIGTMGTRAGIKVEPAGSGSYVLTFSNSSDATYDWNSLPSNVKSATSVKIVTEGDYKMSENDMKKITGEYQSATPFFANLKTLDLEKAELSSYDDLKYFAFDNLKSLETFSFPEKTTTIPLLYGDKGMFQENTHIKTVLLFENPDNNNLSSFNRISDKTFMGASNLSVVRIPEGVEEIGISAFGGNQNHPAPAIESIHFPNTLKRIEENAFAYCTSLQSVTIPYSVNYIGNSAFQWNTSMTDVYVLGNNVEIADGAFNQEETYNFEYQNNGDVDFPDWKPTTQNAQAGTTHPLLLHVPDNDTAYDNYINPFLRMLNDPAFDDPDGNNALLNAVENIAEHSSEKSQINEIARRYGVTVPLTDYGIFKRSNWVTMSTPADGRLKRYFKKANGLFNTYNEVHNNSYGGWRNFMLVACDVEKKTWNDGRLIESRWYSAVFPFDMSYNQVMTTYGAKTDVREFTYVNKHTVDGAEVRTVTFATIPDIPNNDKNKAGFVKKGMPYMIHPGVRSVPVTPQMKAASTSATTTVYRTIAGVDVNAANKVIDEEEPLTVTAHLVNGDAKTRSASIPVEEENAYSFNGTYKTKDIPANSFYLGYEPPTWPLAFYVSRVVMPNKWNPFTAIVRKTSASGNTNASKPMDLGFMEDWGEEGFGIATEIEAAPVVSTVSDDKVYNLNGQVVRENRNQSLAKGVYIVNGKKIVIR